jgi:hypothetical protein
MYTFTYKGVIYSHKDVNELQNLLQKVGYTGDVRLELKAALNQLDLEQVANLLEPVETELLETNVVTEEETMDDIKNNTLVLEDDPQDHTLN